MIESGAYVRREANPINTNIEVVMIKTKSVHSTTTVARPVTTFTVPVTFDTEEWDMIVEDEASGCWTAGDSEKHVKCVMALLRHADGRALVYYRFFENQTYLASFAVMAMPKTTNDAIDWVCAHLLANVPGFWKPLVARFREKYTASPAMVPKRIFYNGYNVDTVITALGRWIQIARRTRQVYSGT
jgi:hypothetical protein